MSLFMDLQSKELMVFATAALPIIELRGAIPFGIAMGLSPSKSFFLSLLGSMVPVPLLIWLIRPIFERLRKKKCMSDMIDYLCARSLEKSHSVQKYGFLGLLVFVAIPLPGTGVWSGALVASLLNMQVRVALTAIFIGNLLAGIAVMVLTYGVFSLVN